MKRSLTLAGAGLAAAGLVLAVIPAGPAAAADPVPCAQMGSNVTILNTATPTCVGLYTSGKASILLPANTPKIIYGVVNMTGSSTPPRPTPPDRWTPRPTCAQLPTVAQVSTIEPAPTRAPMFT